MSFSGVEALGCNVGSGVGISSASLGHSAAGLGHGPSGLGHVKPSLGQNTSGLNHSANGLGQNSVVPGHSPSSLGQSGLITGHAGAASDLDSISLAMSSSSSVFAGHLTSPTVTFPPVSRPSLASMQGIGGFTSPALSPPSPITPNSIASTLGNPQMPSVTCFNSRAPMGFHFRMAGCHLSGVPYVFKRKPEDEPEEVKPIAKQHISEERMAAHLNSLHLSERYCNHRLGKRGWSERKEALLNMEADQGLGEEEQELPSGGGSKDTLRLVICDEVKQIVPGESPLPSQLLKKLRQPKMEVVLWQPPGDVIRNIITTSVNQEKSELGSSDVASDSHTTTSDVPESSTCSQNGSNGSSPDSGVSVTSPPPSLSFAGQDTSGAASSFASTSSSDIVDDVLSLPSTSSGSRGGYLPPLRRPASPLPDPMADDDFSERMEFNNNNDSAPNFMWLEENNNSALIDLNAIEPHRAPHLDDLPDLPDSDDMDL